MDKLEIYSDWIRELVEVRRFSYNAVRDKLVNQCGFTAKGLSVSNIKKFCQANCITRSSRGVDMEYINATIDKAVEEVR